MMTQTTILEPLQGYNLPFLEAIKFYGEHSDLDFQQDLCHYVLCGYMGCTPDFFIMAKFIMLEGEPAFFIRFACGRILEGIKWLTSVQHEIKWIAFCRRNKGGIRKYPVDRLLHLTTLELLASPIFSFEQRIGDIG